MSAPRLRQVVLAAQDLEAAMTALEAALPVKEPFRDPGVGHFGLANAVYALGDTFIEIVSPTRPDTAAGRYMERRGGDCGYMVMFEVSDEQALRDRLASLDVRLVHDHGHPDIVDLHLHPKDVPGAIVAVNVCKPPGSWRWGGPAWTGTIPAHDACGVAGITVAAAEPAPLATRWAGVLGVDLVDSGMSFTLPLSDGQLVTVVPGNSVEGVIGVTVAGAIEKPLEICGVRFSPTP